VQSNVISDPDEPVGGQSEDLAVMGITLVFEGDDRVDPVVAAIELNDNQHAALFLGCGSPDRSSEKARDRRGEGDQGKRAQNIASRDHWFLQVKVDRVQVN
jgi:hypothetical protein